MGKLDKRSLCVLFNRYVINYEGEIIEFRFVKVYFIRGVGVE